MRSAEHSKNTRATAHADDRTLVLIGADETILATVQAELALLPLCTRGRVFIEVASSAQVIPLTAPPRMTVTWLDRSARTGRPGTCEPCRRGEALASAVRAWSAEMFCDGPGNAHATVMGSWELVAPTSDYLMGDIGMTPESLRCVVSGESAQR